MFVCFTINDFESFFCSYFIYLDGFYIRKWVEGLLELTAYIILFLCKSKTI